MGLRIAVLMRTTDMKLIKWPKMLPNERVPALSILLWDPRVTVCTNRVVGAVW